jgi:hypothetical protein
VSRLLSNFGNGLVRAGRDIVARLSSGYTASPVQKPSDKGRSRLVKEAYAVRDAMLAGTIYKRRVDGGYLWDVQHALGKPCAADAPPIIPYYNPVKAIVGCYQNSLGGRLGEELKVEDLKGDPLKPAVEDAIRRIWRWSNLDNQMSTGITLAANQGMTGIRIVADGQGKDARVFLRFEHPNRIFDAEEDARGNLVKVRLKYPMYYSESLDGNYTKADVDEVIGKDGYSQEIDGIQQLEPDQRRNALGICPYVPMRHERRDGFFGIHAYEGSEDPIHGINWGLSQVDEATARAIQTTLFMSGAGDAPDEITLGWLTAIYVKAQQGTPPADMKYITPQLQIGPVGEYITGNIEKLYTNQPELILNALKLLSGTSGETLAQVLKPVEAAVLRARRMYEDSVVRAIQIALSSGVLLGLWNLGTGTGTADAADRAYDDGQGVEAFRFAARPALSPTTAQQIAQATADNADKTAKVALMAQAENVTGLSQNEVLRLGGYTDDQIATIGDEVANQEPTSNDGVDTITGDNGPNP